MVAKVVERTGNIRGVAVRWVEVIVAGHTVEHVLSFDVADAEAVNGRAFDDEMDKHMQMGMFAIDRISADGAMHKVASAHSYILDGKCIRTAKIEHCKDIRPLSSIGMTITRADGTRIGEEWSCVSGTAPISHSDLDIVSPSIRNHTAQISKNRFYGNGEPKCLQITSLIRRRRRI